MMRLPPHVVCSIAMQVLSGGREACPFMLLPLSSRFPQSRPCRDMHCPARRRLCRTADSPGSDDSVFTPADWANVLKGYRSQYVEHDYWVPASMIEGACSCCWTADTCSTCPGTVISAYAVNGRCCAVASLHDPHHQTLMLIVMALVASAGAIPEDLQGTSVEEWAWDCLR